MGICDYRACGFEAYGEGVGDSDLFLSHPMLAGIGCGLVVLCRFFHTLCHWAYGGLVHDLSRLLEIAEGHDLSGWYVSFEFVVFLWLFTLWRYISLSQSFSRTTVDYRFHHFCLLCFIHAHFRSTAVHL